MGQENKEHELEQLELFSYDPIVVVRDVLRRWYLIVAAALLVGMGSYVVSERTYVPDYTATATFVVSVRGSSTTVYENLSAANSLAGVFSEVLNSSLLREKILEEVGIPSFEGTLKATAVAETNLLNLTVVDHDPRIAFLVTRAVLDHHQEVSAQVMGDTILEVLREPVVPTAPSNPLNAVGSMKKGAVLGGLGMCLLLGFLSFLRDSVRSRQEAERKLDTRVLGEIHYERKAGALRRALKQQKTGILITNPATSFTYLEELRKLRRQVEHHMPQGGKVLLVSSALENEGKSTVAVNLGLALAQKRKRVLLIDADLRRPACHKLLEEKQRDRGLAEVLSGKAALDEAVVEWSRSKNFFALLAWEGRENGMDLLGSPRMAELLDEAREKYDFILLDTPPMTAGPDAEYLAELCDASMLVVRQNVASTGTLNGALDALHSTRAKLMGCVLNGMYTPVLSEAGSGDHYGYGYGYGHYGHYGHYGRYGSYGGYAARYDTRRQDGEAGADRG